MTIIQSDREAAAKALGYESWDPACVGSSWADVEEFTTMAEHLAAYRESILSEDRVEEVARAMAESATGLDWDGKWKGERYPNHSYWMNATRAALKTLRGEND